MRCDGLAWLDLWHLGQGVAGLESRQQADLGQGVASNKLRPATFLPRAGNRKRSRSLRRDVTVCDIKASGRPLPTASWTEAI